MTRQRRIALALCLTGLALVAGAWAARGLGAPIGATGLRVANGAGAACVLAGLLAWWSPEACDSATPAQRQRYLRAFLPAMAAYVVVLFASVWLLRRIDDPVWLRALIALTPVVPIVLALRAVVRYIREIDELQQRIELEAVSIATALVSLAYLAAGFLQLAKLIAVPADIAMIWVFPLICLCYGIAKVLVARRYR
ncbi:MAG TPA: hypothetical protein VFX93_16670 [Xanthomonadaceae bacterium]|jgi:hypothetical protein|nr:hypothetical protein [Xanthomonadaceae bacterium]